MKPTLFIFCGLIGVGKTTTANAFGKMINAPVFSVDSTIQRLFEKPSNFQKDAIFNEFELKVCYNAFSMLAESVLQAGRSVIIDGAFAKQWQRDLLIKTAKTSKSPFHVFRVVCPDNVAQQRCEERFNQGKGVGWQGHMQLKKVFEPLKEKHIDIDTSKDVKQQLSDFLKKLK